MSTQPFGDPIIDKMLKYEIYKGNRPIRKLICNGENFIIINN
jgi:hypothetical protein